MSEMRGGPLPVREHADGSICPDYGHAAVDLLGRTCVSLYEQNREHVLQCGHGEAVAHRSGVADIAELLIVACAENPDWARVWARLLLAGRAASEYPIDGVIMNNARALLKHLDVAVTRETDHAH